MGGNFPNPDDLLSTILVITSGIEVSAVHAGDVRNPGRTFPIAILLSSLVSLVALLLGGLAIAIVVPVHELSLTAGLMDAFTAFFEAYHVQWLVPIVAALVVMGSMGVMYFFLFLAGLILRYRQPDAPRGFRVPGGNAGMWILSLLGLTGCLFTFSLGFVPPENVDSGNLLFFESFLGIGVIAMTTLPLLLYKMRKPHWRKLAG